MDERSEARLGDHPGAVDDRLHADGLGRAHAAAELAAFAGDGVDGVAAVGRAEHRREATDLGTASASGTSGGVDDGFAAATELVLGAEVGAQHKVQVGGVDVAVGQHGAAGERRKGRHQAGLAGTALAADHDQFARRRHEDAPRCARPRRCAPTSHRGSPRIPRRHRPAARRGRKPRRCAARRAARGRSRSLRRRRNAGRGRPPGRRG